MIVPQNRGAKRATLKTQLAGILALAIALWCLCGCGTTSSADHGKAESVITEDTAQEILNAATEAAAKASSVTINGHSSVVRGPTLKVELALTQRGGHGTVDLLGSSYEVIRVDEATYVKGPPRIYRRLGITGTIPAGSWVKVSANSRVGALLDLAPETQRIVRTSGNVSKGVTTTVDGQPALELRTEGKLYQGQLYVKATGEPLPLKLEKKGRETGTFRFADWNTTAAPTVPSRVVSSQG